MRYLIVLLVVLSSVASFGIGMAELQSTRAPGEDSFRLSIGTITKFSYGKYPQDIHFDFLGIGPHLGIAYGFSDYFSVGLNTNWVFSPSFTRGLIGDFDLYTKVRYPFPNSPFALSCSLGGLFPIDFYPKITGTFQAWFAYVGVSLHPYMILGVPPWVNLGADIEFSDDLNLLVEIGSSSFLPYAAASLEIPL